MKFSYITIIILLLAGSNRMIMSMVSSKKNDENIAKIKSENNEATQDLLTFFKSHSEQIARKYGYYDQNKNPYPADVHLPADIWVTKRLLEAGANINAKSEKGFTVLMYASQGLNSLEILQYLIAEGAHVNEKDNQGQTVLHQAVEEAKRYYQKYNNPPDHIVENRDLYKDKMNSIKLLIDSGANPTIRDNNGRTPLDLARGARVPGLILLLQTAPTKSKLP